MTLPSPAQLKGCLRDKEILAEIEKRQALTTDQVTSLFFKGISFGHKKAQARLLKLYKGKRVKRCRVSLTEPYCYYTGKRHGRLEHLLDLNWVYVWLVNGLRSWEQIQCFNPEYDLGVLQADGLVGIKNTVTGKVKFYFIEVDRSNNDFDKVAKYNLLYESDGYTGQWWAEMADRFPGILVVTGSPKRFANITERIEQENANNLEFKVMLLDEIKGGIDL